MEQFYLVAEKDECSSLNRDPDYKGEPIYCFYILDNDGEMVDSISGVCEKSLADIVVVLSNYFDKHITKSMVEKALMEVEL